MNISDFSNHYKAFGSGLGTGDKRLFCSSKGSVSVSVFIEFNGPGLTGHRLSAEERSHYDSVLCVAAQEKRTEFGTSFSSSNLELKFLKSVANSQTEKV